MLPGVLDRRRGASCGRERPSLEDARARGALRPRAARERWAARSRRCTGSPGCCATGISPDAWRVLARPRAGASSSPRRTRRCASAQALELLDGALRAARGVHRPRDGEHDARRSAGSSSTSAAASSAASRSWTLLRARARRATRASESRRLEQRARGGRQRDDLPLALPDLAARCRSCSTCCCATRRTRARSRSSSSSSASRLREPAERAAPRRVTGAPARGLRDGAGRGARRSGGRTPRAARGAARELAAGAARARPTCSTTPTWCTRCRASAQRAASEPVTALSRRARDGATSTPSEVVSLAQRGAPRCRARSRTRRRATSRCRIDPLPDSDRWRRDYFGNDVLFFTLAEPHARARDPRRERRRARRRRRASTPTRSPPWEEVAAAVRRGARAPMRSRRSSSSSTRRSSPRARRSPPTRGRRSRPGGRSSRPSLDLCAPDPRATSATTRGHHARHARARDVLRERHGVCQDFAHLMIGCLRSLGLPARYVSGYLRTAPRGCAARRARAASARRPRTRGCRSSARRSAGSTSTRPTTSSPRDRHIDARLGPRLRRREPGEGRDPRRRRADHAGARGARAGGGVGHAQRPGASAFSSGRSQTDWASGSSQR